MPAPPLQVIAQRDAHPAHSAIIMSLEGVFAAIGCWWLLGEVLSLRGLFGCALMLAGMIVFGAVDFPGAKEGWSGTGRTAGSGGGLIQAGAICVSAASRASIARLRVVPQR
nr:hypothetical protein [Geothermobacter hydrogeniphilus]